MQTITYPNTIEYSDSQAEIRKEQFKIEINSIVPRMLIRELNNLPEELKVAVENAKKENVERCRRELIQIRTLALLWYNLDNINDSICNITLYKIKPELKWFVDETKQLFIALAKLATNKATDIKETLQLPSTAPLIGIKSEFIDKIYDVLKPYFPIDQQPQFEKLLRGEILQDKLTFLEIGNRLADSFRQLHNAGIITGLKKHLELWIGDNFQYYSGDKSKTFTKKYLNDIISTDTKECQSPIINVEKDGSTFKIVVLQRTKKRIVKK